MTIDDYLELFPDGISRPSEAERFQSGMIRFTEETASSWGGPCPGGFALYHFEDMRKTSRWKRENTVPTKRAFELAIERLKWELEKLEFMSHRFQRSARKQLREDLRRLQRMDVLALHSFLEWTTEEYPFRLYMRGNDDTSYTRFFKTEEEGLELIELLEVSSPIDFNEFLEFGFFFSN